MHSKIYQISKGQPLYADDFVEAYDFQPEDYSHFADYIDNIDNEAYDELYQSLERLLEGVFTREGDELTYIGAEKFMVEWLELIKTLANELTTESMKHWYDFYKFRSVNERTHLETETRMYYDGELMSFGDFMRTIFADAKPNDKFYLGSILDFHY